MKSYLLLILINLTFIANLTAQKEGNIWYFGNRAGLDFNCGIPKSLSNNVLGTFEGCSSICDNSGSLLFYTDGRTIMNKNHWIMTNGFGLLGDISSTQSAVIVRKPRSASQYYVFTVDNAGGQDGLRYSIVDMNQQNGLGAVTNQKNISVLVSSCEKIAVIKHWNNSDYWIVAHHFGSNKFYSFLLTSTGLDIANPVITAIGSTLSGSNLNTLGYLKASTNGRHIANANYFKGSLEIFDFNNRTGQLSNPMVFHPDTISNPYGTEFSPNSKLVYVSDYKTGKVYQYDLSSEIFFKIRQSKTLINSISGSSVNGALQLGPDKKIYYARNGEFNLAVINNPNAVGTNCDFNIKGPYLGLTTSGIGLPTFYNSIFILDNISYENTCFGDSTFFSIPNLYFDSLYWYFGDPKSGLNNVSTLHSPKHVFTNTGEYEVVLILYSNGMMDTLTAKVKIELPININLGADTTICLNQLLNLSINFQYDNCVWSNNSTGSSIQIHNEGKYWVMVKNQCNMASDTIDISVVDCIPDLIMPDIITPNGDGYNDCFIPLRKKNIHGEKIKIFNRWGQLVYENNLSKAWEGKVNGSPCSDGVYFWVVQFQDSKGENYIKNGSLTVLR